MLDSAHSAPTVPPALERARRLFEFLTRAQELKSAPVRDVASYEYALWLGELPQHPAVSVGDHTFEADSPVLKLERIVLAEAPEPSPLLHPWLSQRHDNSSSKPGLKSELADGLQLADNPPIQRAYQTWLESWQTWAERDRLDRRLQEVYKALFATYVKASSRPEEFELVLGSACLAWGPPGFPAVRRHLFVSALRLELDEQSGALTAVPDAASGLSFEIDALDPGQIPHAFNIQAVRRRAAEFEDHPLDSQAVGVLGRLVLNGLDPDGQYLDALERPQIGPSPRGSFAPAIVLRSRSSRGLVQVFRTISAQLESAADVPEGLRPRVDPDATRQTTTDSSPGGLVQVGADTFMAMPVNDRQRQVIDNVDKHSQTLVQGPPGTGKTHTAAALLTHLLAQGKRVLVTAQTDRALVEVRDKLPEAIQPLAVSVVGASRSEMSELKTAVERIASEAADYDATRSRTATSRSLEMIDDLSRERAFLFGRLRTSRQSETDLHDHLGYNGTLASIAQQVRGEHDKYGWLSEHAQPQAESSAPLSNSDARTWWYLLNDAAVAAHESEARRELVKVETLPSPDYLATMVDSEQLSAAQAGAYADLRSHDAYDAFRRLSPQQRAPLQHQVRSLALRAAGLERLSEPWLDQALHDVRSGRGVTWAGRAQAIRRQVDECGRFVAALRPTTRVQIVAGDVAAHVRLAHLLLPHLRQGLAVKVTPTGEPKLNAFSPKPLKQAASLLGGVRVNDLPPTTADQIEQFLLWHDSNERLDALDRAWPASVDIPQEDTAEERLQWHRTELGQLDRLLALGSDLLQLEHELAAAHVPRPDWNHLAAVEAYVRLPDAATAEEDHRAASARFDEVAGPLRATLARGGSAEVITDLLGATRFRDVSTYASARAHLQVLHDVRDRVSRRNALGEALYGAAPRLAAAVQSDYTNPTWRERLSTLSQAWDWARAIAWVCQQESLDTNALQRQLDTCEQRLHGEIERLAAVRAWQHAVSPQRLSGTARADLTQYAQLVRRLGKGTGKYASAQRAEIRSALDRCGSAVPVWIMPIYRIAEQLNVRQDMFDVIVVDEASQAGVEAAFLQYLAPKIVVIGDDKQVSPSAVGVDQQQLRDLADHYLRDDRYRASWADPTRSLFDEAKMRYGSLITLTEHRRCVPEIIGFSNRIAYEPEGIRLVPVRQYGSDRLTPVVPVHVPDGYTTGGTTKVNDPERDGIVDQIEKCIADPRYDGLTFGVISLLGPTQARRIESALLERIPISEIASRDLRCGDAADFQGSERDVMFLSMVAAPGEGRLAPLTRDLYVQRYNVAASRAKDQLWVFHSVQLAGLPNKEDMRHQLLDYCYAVANRGRGVEGSPSETVPDDVRVEPFDSLFEQRVYNKLVDRGYTVLPQYDAEGYRLDLVVMGGQTRLAVECDGDHWHGADRYDADLARQRELERVGWNFFRIRESSFYIDPAGTMQGLWEALDRLDVRPANIAVLPDDGSALSDEPPSEDVENLAQLDLQNAPTALAQEIDPVLPSLDGTPDGEEPLPLEPDLEVHGPRAEPETSPGLLLRHTSLATGTTFAIYETAKSERGWDPLRGRHLLECEKHGEVSFLSTFRDAYKAAIDPVNWRRGCRDDFGVDETKSSGQLGAPGSKIVRSAEPLLSASSEADMPDQSGEGRPRETTPDAEPRPQDPLPPYRLFVGQLPHPISSPSAEVVRGLLQIVAVEGPIVREALFESYVRCSEAQRLGKVVRDCLGQALGRSVRSGHVLVDGRHPHTTYRLPDQPLVRRRQAGPRRLDGVPLTELAALLEDEGSLTGWGDPGTQMRNALRRLGLLRLTPDAERTLTQALALARQPGSSAK